MEAQGNVLRAEQVALTLDEENVEVNTYYACDSDKLQYWSWHKLMVESYGNVYPRE